MASHYSMPRSAERIETIAEWASRKSQEAGIEPPTRKGTRMSESSEANVPVRGKINYFFTDANGFNGHVELSPDMDVEGDLSHLWMLAQTWSRWMTENSWKASGPVGSKSAPVAAPKAAGAPARPNARQSGGVECLTCNGPVWDNRSNKKNPKSPDYKCKDADCGDAAWIRKDGSVSWASEREEGY